MLKKGQEVMLFMRDSLFARFGFGLGTLYDVTYDTDECVRCQHISAS